MQWSVNTLLASDRLVYNMTINEWNSRVDHCPRGQNVSHGVHYTGRQHPYLDQIQPLLDMTLLGQTIVGRIVYQLLLK